MVTANAYLGGWGITAALEAGADIVVCPRVTDASLVTGPAAWWHGWRRDDWDALAGAVVAGHIIECGPQATGGNYSFGEEITERRYPGFPIAEVAADGWLRHHQARRHRRPGLGRDRHRPAALRDRRARLPQPGRRGPLRHHSCVQQAPDRVAVSGTKGSPPPDTLKVALQHARRLPQHDDHGHHRSRHRGQGRTGHAPALRPARRHRAFAEADVRLLRFDQSGCARTNEQATAHLRITVKDPDERKVGRAFSDAAFALALGGYAGFHTTTPPTRPARSACTGPLSSGRHGRHPALHLPDGSVREIPHTSAVPASSPSSPLAHPARRQPAEPPSPAGLRRPAGRHSPRPAVRGAVRRQGR